MTEPARRDTIFAQIAVKNRLLSKDQVREAMGAVRRGDADSFEDQVIEQDLLSPTAIRRIKRAMDYRDLRLNSKLYARIALKSSLVSQDQIKECLAVQKKAYRKREQAPDLGSLLIQRGLTPEADQAIRDAMEALDRDEYIAKKIASLGEVDAVDMDGSDDAVEEKKPRRIGRRPGKGRAGKKPGARRLKRGRGGDDDAEEEGEDEGKGKGKKGKRGLFGRRKKAAPPKRRMRGRFGKKKDESEDAAEPSDEENLESGAEEAVDASSDMDLDPIDEPREAPVA
ncbi:MAG: hypothetical protein ACYS22_15775, partial [Planctomycetota bacterium]